MIILFGIIAICGLLHVIFFRWVIVIIASHLGFYYFKLGFNGFFFLFSFLFFLFTHKLLCWSKSTSPFYHHFYTYGPWTESISILVSSVHNVSFVLAAFFLECLMFKRTIC